MIKETIGTKQNYTKKDINDKLFNKVNKIDEQWESKVATINLLSLEIENEEINATNLPCSKNDVNNVIERFNSSTGIVVPDTTTLILLGDLEFRKEDNNLIYLSDEGDYIGAVWKDNFDLIGNNLNKEIYLQNKTIPEYDNTCFYKIDIYFAFDQTSSITSGEYICCASEDGENYTKIIDNSTFQIDDGKSKDYYYHSHLIKPNKNFNYIKFYIQKTVETSAIRIYSTGYIRISKYVTHGIPLFQ